MFKILLHIYLQLAPRNGAAGVGVEASIDCLEAAAADLLHELEEPAVGWLSDRILLVIFVLKTKITITNPANRSDLKEDVLNVQPDEVYYLNSLLALWIK